MGRDQVIPPNTEQAFQRSKRGGGRNRRRSKKYLGEIWGSKELTTRQKMILRKTYSVFDCIRIAKHFKPEVKE